MPWTRKKAIWRKKIKAAPGVKLFAVRMLTAGKRLGILCLLALFAFCVAGCTQESIATNDLELARQAQAGRDWPLVERVLRRYLRVEQDSEKRWEAWNLLLSSINAVTPEPRATLECLEVMLVEYDEDESRQASILKQMGECNTALRNYDRAVKSWTAYTELADLPVGERVEGYRKLAAALLARRHFDAAEEALQQCMALPAPDHEKVWCMVDLADAGLGRQQWQDVANLCQQIMESDPPEEVRGLAGYMAGDALEQMGRPEAALRQFEEARDFYPNPAVMDNRITYLKKHIRNKNK